MFESVGGLTIDASSFVKIHKSAAMLRVCLDDAVASCGSVSTTGRPGTVVALSSDDRGVAILSGTDPGYHSVRVIIADSAGASLVDATTTVQVHHVDGISGCPNTATNTGSVTIKANGSLSAT